MRTSQAVAGAFIFLMSCKFEASCGSGSSKTLNETKLKTLISGLLTKYEMPSSSIKCPPNPKMEKDSNFTCQATLLNSDGLVIDMIVTQTSDDGDINVNFQSKVQPSTHVEKGLASQIEEQSGKQVKVDCGIRARLSVPGTIFRCKVQGESEAFDVDIEIQNEEGDWQAKPVAP